MTKGINTNKYAADKIDEPFARGDDQANWGETEAMTDGKSGRLIAEDPDELGFDPDWTKAKLVIPRAKQKISIRLDADVLDWYRQQGKGYQRKIQVVLRAYMEANKHLVGQSPES